MSFAQRLSAFAERVREEFNEWTALRGAANGLAPLDADSKLSGLYLHNAYNRLVQTLTTVSPSSPIDWRNGLFVQIDISANLSPGVTGFLNPFTGEAHVIILRNSSGANRTFTLPNVATHKANTYSITVNNNQRRKLIAHFNGAVYDWTVEAGKTL